MGLLLYAGPGLMRSLTTVLGVEAAALGVGVWSAPGPRPDLLDALRRRWLLALTAFLAATVFTAFWSVVQTLGGGAVGQGLGLAFMAGLPLYAVGGILGAMSAAGAEPRARGGPVGPPVLLGAAVGFAATGVALPRVLTPASLLLICLVMLSAGGLIFGAVLDARLRIVVRARQDLGGGREARVEDRQLPARDRAARFLLEGEAVRRWVALGDEAVSSWEVSVYRAFGPSHESGPAADSDESGPATDPEVLFVGGGASPLPNTIVREHSTARVTVAERSTAVLELGREHLDSHLPLSGDGRVVVRVGNLDDVVAVPGGPYDLVLVDTTAFGAVGGLSGLSLQARDTLWARVRPGGVMVVGPVAPDAFTWAFPEGWSVARYRRDLPETLDGLDAPLGGAESLLVGRPKAGQEWPDRVEGFTRVGGVGA